MRYANEEIIGILKSAREAKGLSQRDLSAMVGVPQSHISKIESGGSDLKLSSLVELARALDLELALVPRKFMPAIDGIIRSAAGQSTDARQSANAINHARAAITKLTRLYPRTPGLDRLGQTIRELANFKLGTTEAKGIRSAADRLMGVQDKAGAALEIGRALDELRTLRNRIAHAERERPQPAYSLDEEDDNV